MPKLELLNDTQPMEGPQAGTELSTRRLIESSADAGARIGSELRSYGHSINETDQQFGAGVARSADELSRDMADQGRKFVEEGSKSLSDAAYNNAMSKATTAYTQYYMNRMSNPTDKDGNPTFSTLPSDMQQAGQQIASQFGGGLAGDAANRFSQDFGHVITSHTTRSMGESRKQQLDYSAAALQSNLSSIKTNAAVDLPNADLYYSQGVSALANARNSGVMSPEDAETAKEKLRSDIYTNRIIVGADKDPVGTETILNSHSNAQLHITQLERLKLQDIVAGQVDQHYADLKSQQDMQAKAMKDYQANRDSEYKTSITEGKTTKADLDQAKNNGDLSNIQYNDRLRQLDKFRRSKDTNQVVQANISRDVNSGNILSGYSAQDLDKWYSGQLSQSKGTWADKARIVGGMKSPVNAFTKDIKYTLQAGSTDDIMQSVQAYGYVQSHNPIAVGSSGTQGNGLDKKSVAMISAIQDMQQHTKLPPDQIIAQVRASMNVDNETMKARNKQFGIDFGLSPKGRLNTPDGIQAATDNEIRSLYGQKHWFGMGNPNIAPETRSAITGLLKDAYALTGDKSKAEKMVQNETAGQFGVTNINGKSTFMFLPPEQVYGPRGYSAPEIKQQFQNDLGAVAQNNGYNVSDLELHADNFTVNNGKEPPAYLVTGPHGAPLHGANGQYPSTGMRWSVGTSEIDKARISGVVSNRINTASLPPPNHEPDTIASIKSGLAWAETRGSKDPYSAMGSPTSRGDRALGKYQVMASNVPSWSKEILGYSITPKEFLSRPDLQEKIVGGMLSKDLQRYKNVQDVFSVWHSGRPLAEASAANAHDTYVDENGVRQVGTYTADYVKGGMAHMSHGVPSDADPTEMATTNKLNDYHGHVTTMPVVIAGVDGSVGSSISQYTQDKSGTPYNFGSKSTDSGAIDCSGWTAEVTLHAMRDVNQKQGPIYDLQAMDGIMHQAAAYQVTSIAKVTGFLPDQDVKSGNLPNGTLIGISHSGTAREMNFAKDRPLGIQHVVMVTTMNGQKYISESSGDVHMMPYQQFLDKYKTDSHLYAVNPFSMVSSAYKMGSAGQINTLNQHAGLDNNQANNQSNTQ